MHLFCLCVIGALSVLSRAVTTDLQIGATVSGNVAMLQYDYYAAPIEGLSGLKITVLCDYSVTGNSNCHPEIVIGTTTDNLTWQTALTNGVVRHSLPCHGPQHRCDTQISVFFLPGPFEAAGVVSIGVYGYGPSAYSITATALETIVPVPAQPFTEVPGTLDFHAWAPPGSPRFSSGMSYSLYDFQLPAGIQDLTLSLVTNSQCISNAMTAYWGFREQSTSWPCDPRSKCNGNPAPLIDYYHSQAAYGKPICGYIKIPDTSVASTLTVSVEASCGNSESEPASPTVGFNVALVINSGKVCSVCATDSDCAVGMSCDVGQCYAE